MCHTGLVRLDSQPCTHALLLGKVENPILGRRPNGFLGLSLDDKILLFLVIL